jgi:hypothetical protein
MLKSLAMRLPSNAAYMIADMWLVTEHHSNAGHLKKEILLPIRFNGNEIWLQELESDVGKLSWGIVGFKNKGQNVSKYFVSYTRASKRSNVNIKCSIYTISLFMFLIVLKNNL